MTDAERWMARRIAASAPRITPEPILSTSPPPVDSNLNPHLWHRLDVLGFSDRTARSLAAANIIYVGELVQWSADALLRLPGFGKRALFEVRDLLLGWNLDVGIHDVGGWTPPDDRPSQLGPADVPAYEWDETPDGVALFVPPALAHELAELLARAGGHAFEIEDRLGEPIVFDDNPEDGFYFDDDDCLVITMSNATAARVVGQLVAGARDIAIGSDVRICVR